MKENTFIDKLFDTYIKKFYIYHHVENATDLELIAFTNGILYILTALKIDPKTITLNNSTLKDEIDKILERYSEEKLLVSDEEKTYDFIHDKDDVGFREYIPSGEG
jgi:hypothetical protein